MTLGTMCIKGVPTSHGLIIKAVPNQARQKKTTIKLSDTVQKTEGKRVICEGEQKTETFTGTLRINES